MAVHEEVGILRLDATLAQLAAESLDIGDHIGVVHFERAAAAFDVAAQPLQRILAVAAYVDISQPYRGLELDQRKDVLRR